MAVSVTHSTIATLPDELGAEVNKAEWNAAHTVTGLTPGVDVQAWSANLDEYAAVNPTAAGLALLDDSDAAAQRTTLGLGTIATQNTPLGVTVGGTGLTALTANRIPYASATNTLGTSADLTFNGATFVALNISSSSQLKAGTILGIGSSPSFIGSSGNGIFEFYDNNVSAVNGRLRIGTLGIGTTAPDKVLEVNLGTADAFRLTYNDANGSAATYMDTTLSSAGVTTFTGAGSAPAFSFAQAVTFGARADLKSYTVATLPAAGAAGGIVYASDAAVAPCLAFSNGTNWKRCDNAATTVV